MGETYARGAAAVLSVTLVPVLMGWFLRGWIRPKRANPLNRLLIRIYHPAVDVVLRWRKLTLLAALLAILSSAWPLSKMGSEFMPALYEGDLLYMPTTLPGLSVTKAREVLQRRFPGTLSAISMRVVSGGYLDITIDRLQAARYGSMSAISRRSSRPLWVAWRSPIPLPATRSLKGPWP